MTIAYCFLMKGDHRCSEIWEKYFAQGNEYNIYVNVKYPNKVTSFLKHYIIPNNVTNTQWGDISLVDAEIKLFENGLKDEKNTHFVLISDSCIPLYSFDNLTKKVKEFDNVVYLFKDQYVGERRKKIKSEEFKSKYVNHHQWVILNRKSAQIVTAQKFKLKWLSCVRFQDECFIGTLLKLNKIRTKTILSTYVAWTKGQPHPDEFKIIGRELIDRARHSGSILLRKVSYSPRLNSKHLLDL